MTNNQINALILLMVATDENNLLKEDGKSQNDYDIEKRNAYEELASLIIDTFSKIDALKRQSDTFLREMRTLRAELLKEKK